MPNNSTQSFDNVSLLFGVDLIKGYFAGAGLTVSYRSDWWDLTVGPDGFAAWTKKADLSATIVVNLAPGSNSNAVFTRHIIRDLQSSNGVLRGIVLREKSGATLFKSDGGRLIKPADVSFGDTATAKSWTITCARLVPFIGGIAASEIQTDSLQDAA
jgi:hypothetical protein